MGEIILTNPGIPVKLTCPRCRDKHIRIVEIRKVKCKKCQLIFDPVDLIEPQTADLYMAKIVRDMSESNETKIYCETHMEKEILYIKQLFRKQGNVEISGPKQTEKINIKSLCTECGYCNNCVTCAKCGTNYEPANKLTKCPKCNGRETKRTHIQKFKMEHRCAFKPCKNHVPKDVKQCPECGYNEFEDVPICPHCGSDNIGFTVFKNKMKCPLCKSEKISERKKYVVHELIIKRLPAFRKENLRIND